jgi:hypothetical protein
MIFLFNVITDVDGMSLGVRWLDRHILLNQMVALALCSFCIPVGKCQLLLGNTITHSHILGILFKFHI